MTTEEIVNLIMNGAKIAENEGRKNLQEWGIEMIEEYAKQKCKEQRELCAEKDGKVLNAPEPEFD